MFPKKKVFTLLMAALMSVGCFSAFAACAEPTPPDVDDEPPVEQPIEDEIIPLDLENSLDFKFEAENATLVGDAMRPSSKSVSEDYDLYMGNGHVVENEGASNGKFVGYMGAKKGDYIEYKIYSEVSCEVTLSIAAASNLRLYYFICWRDVDTGVFLNGEQLFMDENDKEKTVDIVAMAFNENIVYENVILKKGENTIRIQALAEEALQFWTIDRRPKAVDLYGKAYSKIPNIDYIKITASVPENNFRFENETFDNEINTNGKNTLNKAPWYNGYIYTDDDYATYETWVDNK